MMAVVWWRLGMAGSGAGSGNVPVSGKKAGVLDSRNAVA